MSHHRFPRAGRLRRGYHCRQVDQFMVQVEVSLSGMHGRIGPDEIRRIGFELVRHGYEVGPVDAALDDLEERALTVLGASTGRRARLDPEGELAVLREQISLPYMRRFPRAHWMHRGYNVDDVDDYLDEVLDALSHDRLVDVDEVRRVGFRPKRGGYDEAAVDDTLDRVVGLLLLVTDAPAAGVPDTAGSAAGAPDPGTTTLATDPGVPSPQT
ncbi:MAG: hypothetical protein QOE01_922 [Actinomycetota bacterium]|nr:hypothetical protein [Actinomycetota bacterium]